MQTVEDILFDTLFSQFDSSVILLYQIRGITPCILVSNADLLRFVRTFNEISACQDFININCQKRFILFTYCDNIQTWLWNRDPIPDNVDQIIIFCPFDSDVEFIKNWAKRYIPKVTHITTFDRLEHELLIVGMKYIGDLCLYLEGNPEILKLLEEQKEKIRLALMNNIREVIDKKQ